MVCGGGGGGGTAPRAAGAPARAPARRRDRNLAHEVRQLVSVLHRRPAGRAALAGDHLRGVAATAPAALSPRTADGSSLGTAP